MTRPRIRAATTTGRSWSTFATRAPARWTSSRERPAPDCATQVQDWGSGTGGQQVSTLGTDVGTLGTTAQTLAADIEAQGTAPATRWPVANDSVKIKGKCPRACSH